MSIRSKSLLFVISILTASLLLQSTHYHLVDSAPIIPILTAIASSAAGIFQIQVDTLHIAKYLRESANCKKNRGAFVRDLLYTAFYRSGQTHNVMVFNLGEEHRQRLYGVLFYGSVNYVDGTRFGVWVFESGVFENKGARGWHNWGMIGTFKKSSEGDTIYFQRRHRPPSSSTTSTITSNGAEDNNYSTTVPSNRTASNITITDITASSTTSASITRTTVKPVDILLGFSEDKDVVSTLMKDKNTSKNFIDEKSKAEVDGVNGEDDHREKLTPIRVSVNIKPKEKETSSSSDEKSRENKKQTPPKAKRANSLSKTGKSTKLE